MRPPTLTCPLSNSALSSGSGLVSSTSRPVSSTSLRSRSAAAAISGRFDPACRHGVEPALHVVDVQLGGLELRRHRQRQALLVVVAGDAKGRAGVGQFGRRARRRR